MVNLHYTCYHRLFFPFSFLKVFQRCGELQKIVTFVRNEQFHALIQYSNCKEAAAAKALFDHQNIYNGCNTLHVDFSKMTELTVKYNNEKMRYVFHIFSFFKVFLP